MSILGIVIPLLSCALLLSIWGVALNLFLLSFVMVALLATVLIAVHHAEIIALKVGEPFGTLILALAVTVIEVSLIIALMLSGGTEVATLARDTVYATVMIICNGVIGLCLLMGTLRHRVLAFRVEGTSPSLSVLVTLSTLILILPSFTTSTLGPTLSNAQLIFAGIVSLTLYLVFVFVQTVRHREYFLPIETSKQRKESKYAHINIPSTKAALFSLTLLVLSLIAVVGLAKTLAPTVEEMVMEASVPHVVVGIAIALMVLLPETWAAVRAAVRNRMQTSFNLALGSALATIGLTIPAVAMTSIIFGLPLELGLPNKEIVLLILTLLISTMTLARGSATLLQGTVHLVLFAVFLFLAIEP